MTVTPLPRWEKNLFAFGFLLCAGVILATLLRGADRTDLNILLNAATRLEHGEKVYEISDTNENTKPPLASLLFVPLNHADPSTLKQVWDGLNILIFIALVGYLVKVTIRARFAASTGIILVLMVLLNPWNKEIRLGQYNILTLTCLLVAGLGIGWRPLAWGRGLLLAIALLLKPTNVVFLPWIWRHARARRAVLQGAIGCLCALSLVYVYRYGAPALWRDTVAWLRFLPLSTAKHLHQADNFGLVRFLDEAGLGRWIAVACALGWLGVFAAAFASQGWLLGFSVAGMVSILLTPMAWFQNYALLAPFVVYLLAQLIAEGSDWTERLGFALALAALYAGLEINPALCGPGIGLGFCHALVPLWSLLAAIACAGFVPACSGLVALTRGVESVSAE